MNTTTRVAAVSAVAILAAACAGPTVDPDTYLHMICVDEDGDAAPLRIKGQTERGSTPIDIHVKNIAERYWYECIHSATNPRDLEIVLVIHGGLVSMQASVEAAAAALGPIRAAAQAQDPPASVFPIFVNWETGIVSAYTSHLFSVRHGREEPLWYTIPTAPFTALIDIGRAVTRLVPILFTSQGIFSVQAYRDPRPQAVPNGWLESAWIDTDDQVPGFWERAGDAALTVFPGLARIATTPLLDTIGYSAYGNMARRARVLFLRDEDYDGGHPRPTGALSLLMHHLLEPSHFKQESVADLQRKLRIEHALAAPAEKLAIEKKLAVAERILESNRYPHESLPFANVGEPTFQIMAHSMGTHVANGLVRRYGREATFREIIFMGAACSIREFVDQTLPYIVQNPDSGFYNLCLHPTNEIGEWSYGGTMPHGSLLVWVDSYITEIRTEMDCTLGHWNNVMRALPIIDNLTSDIRRRIKIRGFPRAGDYPRKHGEFNDLRFQYWRPEYRDAALDPATRFAVGEQVEKARGRITAEAAAADAQRKLLQKAFDRKLAAARTAREVSELLAVYRGLVEDEESKANTAGRELDVARLVEYWKLQAAARCKDIAAGRQATRRLEAP